MCRTGRVFRPEVDGEKLSFVLIGANLYNAILEDTETGSWWWQATGRGVLGPKSGSWLPAVPHEQLTLAEWLALHPASDVMQPDPASAELYAATPMHKFDGFRAKYDDPNQAEEHGREWVLAAQAGGAERAYPWLALERQRVILDELGGVPIALQLRSDGISFRVFEARVDGEPLALVHDPETDELLDTRSGARFGFDGRGRGTYAGCELPRLDAQQERWRAYRVFRSNQDRYRGAPQ